MPPAAGLRRSAVDLAVSFALPLCIVLAGCAAGPKKKVASAESEKIEEPMTKWESAGETMPPAKAPAPEKPPEMPAPPDPAKAAAAAGGQPARGAPSKPAPTKKTPPPKKEAARKPTPARKGGGASGASVAIAPVTSGNADEDDALLKPVLTIDSIAGAAATPSSPSSSSTTTTHATIGAPASKIATVERVPITPAPESARKVEPAPPPAPPPPPPPAATKVEPPPPPPPKAEPPPSKPEPPHEKAIVTREPIREKAPPARVVPEEPPRELHATIGGKTIVFRDGVILGNRRHGYAIQAFELPGSTKEAEVDVTIEAVDLKKRKALPVKLIYLRILDDGPQSSKGVRELSCRGRGELVLDNVPPLPKKLPQDALDVGDAAGSLALEVSCARDSLEFGSFTIEGRVLFRVLVIPADM